MIPYQYYFLKGGFIRRNVVDLGSFKKRVHKGTLVPLVWDHKGTTSSLKREGSKGNRRFPL
jgi:hypothetical protein